MLTNSKDISEFINDTKKMLDSIGTKIVQKALETVDVMVKEDKRRKEQWRVKNKSANKSIATIFGEVNYTRTYYENKRAGKTKNKKIKILYIEADEDHVSLQSGKCVETKLIYVHEGKEQVSKDRYRLKNARYFSGIRLMDRSG